MAIGARVRALNAINVSFITPSYEAIILRRFFFDGRCVLKVMSARGFSLLDFILKWHRRNHTL